MELVALRWLLVALASVVGILQAAVVAQAALAADNPPIVSVGPATDPTGAVTGSGTVGSDGQVGACTSVPASGCQSGGSSGSQNAGQGASGSSSGTGAQTGGSAGTGARAGAVAGAATTATVAAREARGIKIVRIRYTTSALRSGRLRVIVTVRDVDGRLIRDAIVSLRPLQGAKPTLAGSMATFSNSRGDARFSVPVAKRLLGRRLRFVVSARTPTARALELASFPLSPSAAG